MIYHPFRQETDIIERTPAFFKPGFFSVVSVGHVGKQRHKPGALDRGRQISLMLRASAGDAAGKDLRALGDILPKTSGVLVVDILRLLHAEHADLFLSAVRAERSALRIVSVHLEQPFRLTISIPFRCEPVRIGGKGRRQKGSDSSFGISSNPELPLFE